MSDKVTSNDIFSMSSEAFNAQALKVFRYQSLNNPVYAKFIRLLGMGPNDVKNFSQIPYLPISAFKHHKVITAGTKEEIIFTSTGTGGLGQSKHYVSDLSVYRKSFTEGFRHFYGDPSEWCFLALLPSYLERSGSSLIYMMEKLIQESTDPDSGFYLEAKEELIHKLKAKAEKGKKTLLIGVSFALLDLAERGTLNLSGITVMETGGFKGRRKEIGRKELHDFLCDRFRLEHIHSEYGMTELLSQAYSSGKGRFSFPPWAKMVLRDTNDPLQTGMVRRGAINVADLANINSCSFIATDDLGEQHEDETFSVNGRLEASDLRGCNLLVSS